MTRRKFFTAAAGFSTFAAAALWARRMMGGSHGGMMGGSGRAETIEEGESNAAGRFFNPLAIPPEIRGEVRKGVRHYDLRIQAGVSEFFPGVKTPTWGINGPYLGPTIRLRDGEEVSLDWHNTLGEATTMHGHGMHLPAEMDGNVHQLIPPGGRWSARYRVNQKACTNWYHPHTMGRTAEQVILGLGGLIFIDDEESLSHPLPGRYGVDDIPLVIQDRLFTQKGKFAYPKNMRTVMHGFSGNTLLVNGTIAPYKEVEAGLIRLRLLNASNARVYRLSFGKKIPMTLIAGDNSFLERPRRIRSLLLSPAERAEVVLDLGEWEGKKIVLRDQRSGAGVLELRVRGESRSETEVPDRLTELERPDFSAVRKTRSFRLEARGPGRLLINGRSMDPKRIDERVPLEESEIWEVESVGMGRMMGMNHNFHMHAAHFRVLERNGSRKKVRPWERGYKDTVFLAPGDRVKLLVRHADYVDPEHPYMYHCHILEHEDAGMMGQFVVV